MGCDYHQAGIGIVRTILTRTFPTILTGMLSRGFEEQCPSNLGYNYCPRFTHCHAGPASEAILWSYCLSLVRHVKDIYRTKLKAFLTAVTLFSINVHQINFERLVFFTHKLFQNRLKSIFASKPIHCPSQNKVIRSIEV